MAISRLRSDTNRVMVAWTKLFLSEIEKYLTERVKSPNLSAQNKSEFNQFLKLILDSESF